MQNKHKVVLVPTTERSVIGDDCGKVRLSEIPYCLAANWQPQRILILGEGCKGSETTVYNDNNNIHQIMESCKGCCRTIIAAYPKLEDIPTIELSDIQEMERRGWPESVEIYPTIYRNGSIVINWEPETKPEIVEAKVMTVSEWMEHKGYVVISLNLMRIYAEYYHKEKLKLTKENISESDEFKNFM